MKRNQVNLLRRRPTLEILETRALLACDLPQAEFGAYLSGLGQEHGSADFQVECEHGQSSVELSVELQNAVPGSAYPVSVGGVPVGSVQVDQHGRGELKLSSDSGDDDRSPLPAGFPSISAGTSVTVGSVLSGTFGASETDDHEASDNTSDDSSPDANQKDDGPEHYSLDDDSSDSNSDDDGSAHDLLDDNSLANQSNDDSSDEHSSDGTPNDDGAGHDSLDASSSDSSSDDDGSAHDLLDDNSLVDQSNDDSSDEHSSVGTPNDDGAGHDSLDASSSDSSSDDDGSAHDLLDDNSSANQSNDDSSDEHSSDISPNDDVPGYYGSQNDSGRDDGAQAQADAIRGNVIGDVDFDGRFTSLDIVKVLQAGEYEDGIRGNSTWATGDWDGNHEFDRYDLVFALQQGRFDS